MCVLFKKKTKQILVEGTFKALNLLLSEQTTIEQELFQNGYQNNNL